ncbi:cell filamentation protein Fic [Salmonella enterica subsp. enterica serovar Choleraesuis]|nr:cell filamentation protein Fic [Salmonella enterica subsp. enterica serovar Choleraesuis]
MSDKFGAGRDPYYWSGIAVLRNRLDIRENSRLMQAEREFTALRAASLPLGPAQRGLPHLCAIHRFLFQDVYAWAGEMRKVDIYQGDTRFCHFEYIEKEGNALMQALEDERYLSGLERSDFIRRLSHFYGEINVLHPFRIGSGRAQRIFFEQLAIHAGYVLDWSRVETGAWRYANQQAALGRPQELEAIFGQVIGEAEAGK